MFAQQVDTKFLPCFCKPPLAVKRDDVGENPTTLVVVYELEELFRHVNAWFLKDAVEGGAVIIVNACVLVVECAVEDATTK